MLDWLIVGGGVHGTYLSLILTTLGGVAGDRLRVLDAEPRPLHRWRACCANTGMRWLRSPVVHHLGGRSLPLRTFAARTASRDHLLLGPYLRPSLTLFHAHVDEICRTHRLERLRIQGRAGQLALRSGGGFRVDTTAGAVDAHRVVLALGGAEPSWPAWARSPSADGRVHHVLDPAFRRSQLGSWEAAVVIGGGLSAVETALALAAERPGGAVLLHRSPLRVEDFDADPAWLGPRRLRPFQRASAARRRALVDAARPGGSAPPAETEALRRAELERRLRTVQGEVRELRRDEERLALELADGTSLTADRILLATGLSAERPGGAWLDRTIDELGLPCAACGWPRLDTALQWQPGLHASGALAELELGPLARNIAGALFAAERLLGMV